MIGLQETATFMTVVALLGAGLTTFRTWLIGSLSKINLGSEERNIRLRVVVCVSFFGLLISTSVFLLMFLLTMVGFNAVTEVLVSEDNSLIVKVIDVSSLSHKSPYLGAILNSDSDGSGELAVLNFYDEIVNPIKIGILVIAGLLGLIMALILALSVLIAYIVKTDANPTPAGQEPT